MVPLVPTFPPMVTLAPMVPLAAEKRSRFSGFQWYQWLPMVPLVKFLMVPLGESRTHAISFICLLFYLFLILSDFLGRKPRRQVFSRRSYFIYEYEQCMNAIAIPITCCSIQKVCVVGEKIKTNKRKCIKIPNTRRIKSVCVHEYKTLGLITPPPHPTASQYFQCGTIFCSLCCLC